jgi:histidinol-phosphate aminotransferase
MLPMLTRVDERDIGGNAQSIENENRASPMYVRREVAAMSGYTAGEQPQAGTVVKLNTNENPYPPSASVALAIGEAIGRGLSRYPDPLANGFRARAAEVLGVGPEWILCGNGSDDILTIVTRAFVGQHDLLRVPYPSYSLYRTLAEIQAAAVEEVPFNSDWTLPAPFAADRDRVRLACLPNPNSPSGTMVAREAVLEIAKRLPCPLLVDEAYVDFAGSNCLDFVAKNDKVLVSRSMSKSYALAGLRFGFLVAQPHVIEQLIKVKDSYNCDALAIAGATAAIDDQAWLADNRRRILATRERMTVRLTSLGFGVVPSQANFVWCTSRGVSAEHLYEQLKSHGVLVRYLNYPGWGDGLRISVGTDDQVDTCLGLLESLVA